MGVVFYNFLIERNAMKWNEVKTHMPDGDTTVLVFNKDSNEPVWFGYFDGLYWRDVYGGLLDTPTHWAEMPEGPTA